MVEPLLAEPSGFQRVIAMREARIGVGHRLDQRLDDLALDPIGEVPRIRHVGEFSPPVGDFLVLGERARDESEQAQVRAERGGERVRRRLAFRRVRVLKLAEQRLEREALALEVESQRRRRVVEQPIPRGAAADRLLQEQSLEIIGQLMGLLLADVLEPWTVMPERWRSHRRLEPRVVDAVELELEEQEIAGERRHAFVRVAVELRPAGVAGVGGIEERRIGHDAPGQILHRFVGPDRGGERLARVRTVGEFR